MPQLAEAKVVGLYTSPKAGAPMEAQHAVRAIAGAGLAGDRYAEGTGAYSKAKPPKVRHVTLVSLEAIAESNMGRDEDQRFDPSETRRNIVTQGIDLNGLVGEVFTVGGVKMMGTELAEPCARPSKLSGKKGFAESFENRGGLRARIISDGAIAIDDGIEVFKGDGAEHEKNAVLLETAILPHTRLTGDKPNLNEVIRQAMIDNTDTIHDVDYDALVTETNLEAGDILTANLLLQRLHVDYMALKTIFGDEGLVDEAASLGFSDLVVYAKWRMASEKYAETCDAISEEVTRLLRGSNIVSRGELRLGNQGYVIGSTEATERFLPSLSGVIGREVHPIGRVKFYVSSQVEDQSQTQRPASSTEESTVFTYPRIVFIEIGEKKDDHITTFNYSLWIDNEAELPRVIIGEYGNTIETEDQKHTRKANVQDLEMIKTLLTSDNLLHLMS